MTFNIVTIERMESLVAMYTLYEGSMALRWHEVKYGEKFENATRNL